MVRAVIIKGFFFVYIVLISVLAASFAYAEPVSCSITNGPCTAGTKAILTTAGITNAHVAGVSYNDFTYSVCCPSSISDDNTNVIARFSSAGTDSNGHEQGHLCAPDDNNCLNAITGSWTGCSVVSRDTATGECPASTPSCVISVSSEGHVSDCSIDTYGSSVLCCNPPAQETCKVLGEGADCTDANDGPLGDGWHCDTTNNYNKCCPESSYWDDKSSSCGGPTDCRYEGIKPCSADPDTNNLLPYLTDTSNEPLKACVNGPLPFDNSCSDLGILSGLDRDGDGVEDNIHDYQNILPVCKADDSIERIEFNGGGPWEFNVYCKTASDGICPEDYNNALSGPGTDCSLGCKGIDPDCNTGCPTGYSPWGGTCLSLSADKNSVIVGEDVTFTTARPDNSYPASGYSDCDFRADSTALGIVGGCEERTSGRRAAAHSVAESSFCSVFGAGPGRSLPRGTNA